MWTLKRCVKPANFFRNYASAVKAEKSTIDDFLNSIAPSTTVIDVKKTDSFKTFQEFHQWMKETKFEDASNFIEASDLAMKLSEKERIGAIDELNNVSKTLLPGMMSSLALNESLLVLSYLLTFKSSANVISDLQNRLISQGINPKSLSDVPFSTLMSIVFASENENIDSNLLESVIKSIKMRISDELDKPAQLLTLFNSAPRELWFDDMRVIKKCEQLLPLMNMGEKCAVMKHMAMRRQRNKQLLQTLAQLISRSTETLSVSQIVSLISSCTTFTLLNAPLIRKISADICHNSNVFRKWDDIVQIANCYSRLRIGDENVWKTLINWSKQNSSQSTVDQMSRFVGSAAKIGYDDGRIVAEILKKRLNKSKAKTPASWLNIIHSLAYFQVLDEGFADSVLNKSFVDHILTNSHEKHDRLRKAMILLNISEAARKEIKGYHGPLVNKESFKSYGIEFGTESIRHGKTLKHSLNNPEYEELFLSNLFKVAPQDTHCKHSNIEESGVFVDAYVLPEENATGRLLHISQWGTRKPRPVMFFSWMHLRQLDGTTGESSLCGNDKFAMRLLRINCYEPVIIMKTDLDFCKNEIERMNLFKEKIHLKK